MITTTLLLILAFSLTSNTFLVSGDAGGTGKYLEINFTTLNLEDTDDLLLSDTEVTALKVSSGQLFTFEADDSLTYNQKVGAGTVELEALPANGWIFSHFIISGEVEPNLSEYKTKKLDVVDAVFDRLSYPVAASVIGGVGGSIVADGVNLGLGGVVSVYHGEFATFEFIPDEGYFVSNVDTNNNVVYDAVSDTYQLGPIISDGQWISVELGLLSFDIELNVLAGEGEIWYNGAFEADQDNSGIVTVNYWDEPTFEFRPERIETLHHLASVLVDDDLGTGYYVDLVLTEFTQTFTFSAIKEAGHSLDVVFSVDGEAAIPGGLDVTVFLSSAASLNFDDVGDGVAFGNEILATAPGDVVVWDISVDNTILLGDQVIVALRYDDTGMTPNQELNLRMYRADVDYELYLKVDYNGDGVIDGQDVRVISNIIKHTKFIPDPKEDPVGYQFYLDNYDLDGNEIFDQRDVHVVNQMKNVEWIDITLRVDTENNIIYGETEHFSIFRGR